MSPNRYQTDGEYLLHDGSVVSLVFGADGRELWSASTAGEVKVWDYYRGACVGRVDGVGAVVSIAATRRGRALCGTAEGQLVTVGMRSSKVLDKRQAHQGAINAVVVAEGKRPGQAPRGLIITAGNDGVIKTWDEKTKDCISELSLGGDGVIALKLMPRNTERMIAATRDGQVHVLTLRGQSVHSCSIGVQKGATGSTLVALTVSPKGGWAHALADDGKLYCFSTEKGRLEYFMDTVCAKKTKRFSLAALANLCTLSKLYPFSTRTKFATRANNARYLSSRCSFFSDFLCLFSYNKGAFIAVLLHKPLLEQHLLFYFCHRHKSVPSVSAIILKEMSSRRFPKTVC